MPNLKTIWVDGEPVPQPRQRHRVVLPALGENGWRGVPYGIRKWVQKAIRVMSYTPDSPPVQAWKKSIKHEWRAQHGQQPVEGIPMGITLTFIRSRPKAMTRKTKPNPRIWDHWSVGDADNLAKAVLDALEGEAYKNDSQIAHLVVFRFIAAGDSQSGCGWDERVGVMVELKELAIDLTPGYRLDN